MRGNADVGKGLPRTPEDVEDSIESQVPRRGTPLGGLALSPDQFDRIRSKGFGQNRVGARCVRSVGQGHVRTSRTLGSLGVTKAVRASGAHPDTSRTASR